MFICCQQAGTVGGRPIISAANTRMNATIATNQLQTAPIGNIVIRPTQPTVVVGPTAANTVQPPVPIVDGRIIAASTSVANVPRPLVPANAAVAGMLL